MKIQKMADLSIGSRHTLIKNKINILNIRRMHEYLYRRIRLLLCDCLR